MSTRPHSHSLVTLLAAATLAWACSGPHGSTNVPDLEQPDTPEPQTGCLELSTRSLSLPAVEVGCRRTGAFTLRNACTDDIRLVSLTFEEPIPGYGFIDTPGIPEHGYVLGPGGARDVVFAFEPLAEGASSNRVLVSWRSRGGPAHTEAVRVDARAEGDIFRSDTEELPPRERYDLLIVIDNGQKTLSAPATQADDMAALARNIASSRFDVNVAMVTTGTSATSTRAEFVVHDEAAVLSNRHDGFVEAFLSKLQAIQPAIQERHDLFRATLEALSPEKLAGPNAGWRRDDALLDILLITADRESSPITVATFLDGLRIAARHAAVHGVIPLSLSHCASEKDDGRIRHAITLTGGGWYAVCGSGWGQAFSGYVCVDCWGPTMFWLSRTPDFTRAPLVVSVNDRVMPPWKDDDTANWWWDARLNAVVFDLSSAPAPDDLIRVDYAVACDLRPAPGD